MAGAILKSSARNGVKKVENQRNKLMDKIIDCSFYRTKEKAEKALASRQYNRTRAQMVIQEMRSHWAIIPRKYAASKDQFVQQ
jgi:hypothetical protein